MLYFIVHTISTLISIWMFYLRPLPIHPFQMRRPDRLPAPVYRCKTTNCEIICNMERGDPGSGPEKTRPTFLLTAGRFGLRRPIPQWIDDHHHNTLSPYHLKEKADFKKTVFYITVRPPRWTVSLLFLSFCAFIFRSTLQPTFSVLPVGQGCRPVNRFWL